MLLLKTFICRKGIKYTDSIRMLTLLSCFLQKLSIVLFLNFYSNIFKKLLLTNTSYSMHLDVSVYLDRICLQNSKGVWFGMVGLKDSLT